MNLYKSRTEENLRRAFAAEAEAAVRLRLLSVEASAVNLSLSKRMEALAEQRIEAGAVWLNLLRRRSADVPTDADATMDASKQKSMDMPAAGAACRCDGISDGLALLAADAENDAFIVLPRCAEEADAEGFDEIADRFRTGSAIRLTDRDMLRRLGDAVQNGSLFLREEGTVWECARCGCLRMSAGIPVVCPFCNAGRAFFRPRILF